MITTSRAFAVVDAALDYRAMRQDLIAGNIANVDTPYYRPRDVDFQQLLIQKRNESFGIKDRTTLPMAQTDAAHLAPLSDESNARATLFFRDGHAARNDGNSVDLDVETSELGKNSIMYGALISARKRQSGIFSAMLEASGKTS